MQTLVIIFMAFAGVICLLALVTIILDIAKEARANKQNAPQPVVAQPQIDEPTVEIAATQTEVDADEKSNENGVWFATKEAETLEQKYLALSQEAKGWYDEIEHYAMAQEGVKHTKTAKCEDYKIGKNRIVKLFIKRGVVTCEFVLVNQDFKNYVADNKVSVKHSNTTMKVENDEAVATAKHFVDLAVKATEDERLYKQEQRKLRRKQARLQKQQEQDAQSQQN